MDWKRLSCLLAIQPLCFLTGEISNGLAINLNQGLMPVIAEECTNIPGETIDYLHACAGPTIHVRWLCDFIPWGRALYSPGDVLILGSEWLGVGLGLFLIGLALCVTIKRLRIHVRKLIASWIGIA